MFKLHTLSACQEHWIQDKTCVVKRYHDVHMYGHMDAMNDYNSELSPMCMLTIFENALRKMTAYFRGLSLDRQQKVSN